MRASAASLTRRARAHRAAPNDRAGVSSPCGGALRSHAGLHRYRHVVFNYHMKRPKRQQPLMPTLVRLEPAVVEQLDKLARETDRSRASVIRIAVGNMLAKHGAALEAAANG
jgi:hypothetical protein